MHVNVGDDARTPHRHHARHFLCPAQVIGDEILSGAITGEKLAVIYLDGTCKCNCLLMAFFMVGLRAHPHRCQHTLPGQDAACPGRRFDPGGVHWRQQT